MNRTELKTPYYMFYADEFIHNYKELEETFKAYYPKYKIAYSFKTNYTPAVCELIKQLGGYAEVVSDMEYELARKIGFDDKNVVYNGPGKGKFLVRSLLNGGLLNIDNFSELDNICQIAKDNIDKQLNIGIRVNFDIGNSIHSRFGFDIENGDLQKSLDVISKVKNLSVKGLHFHISRARGTDAWKKRIDMMLEIADKYFDGELSYIDIGSGMYGHLDPELQEQFGDTPSYEDYAIVVAKTMANHYKDVEDNEKPILITEPGTTLVSKYFHMYSMVLDIKEVRGKYFALLDGSFHNIGEICGLKKIPIHVHSFEKKDNKKYQNIDLVGYTCLEQDVIYRGYEGYIAKNDILEFCNVGGYSIVSKPPFIHPDIPIYMKKDDNISCIKREQTMDDIFRPYYFGTIKEEV